MAYDHWQACSSHTDENKSKPSHAPQDSFFLPDALIAANLPISGLWDQLWG